MEPGVFIFERKCVEMFREMRRKKQVLPEEVCTSILNRGTSGVLALMGDEGYPYAVPMSYVYDDGKLYFHCAKEGHKLDAVRRCSKASFCVIDQDQIVPEEYTTYFRSVILFGTIRILEGEVRYASLHKTFPENAKELFAQAEQEAQARYESYQKMAEQE